MIYSYMLNIMNLGAKSSVDSSATAIQGVITKSLAAESTGAMPVTRDLSQGKRLVLQLYLYLVTKQFNVLTLTIQNVGQ